MSVDPRRTLEEAAQRRVGCELLARDGEWTRGTVVRVEKAGVVVTVPERRFSGGEHVRVWFALDGRPFTFEASVIRTGVPVPDRSQDGVLIGFIDRWTEGVEAGDAGGRVLELVLSSGGPVSLLAPPARVVELSVSGLVFMVPVDFKLVFVEGGTVNVRIGVPGRRVVQVVARVRTLALGDGYLLYGIDFQEVDDPEALRVTVEELPLK